MHIAQTKYFSQPTAFVTLCMSLVIMLSTSLSAFADDPTPPSANPPIGDGGNSSNTGDDDKKNFPPPVPPPQQFFLDTCWTGIRCGDTPGLFRQWNNVVALSSGVIALSIFIVGAFMMVISGGNDTLLQSAKRAMKGSLIGVALIMGSYGIYRTVVFLLYG